MDDVTRQECNDTMRRSHERIDSIEKTSVSIETSAKNIERCVNDMKSLMYGSEKGEGIITKVSNIFTILKIHWGFIWLIIGGILTMAFFIIRTAIQ